jgi:hypothetical protein
MADNENGNAEPTTTNKSKPTTTTTVEPSTTTTVPVINDEHDESHHHTDENLDGEYLVCDDIREEVIQIVKPFRVEVFTHCNNTLYSLDISKMPIIQVYQSEAYDKPYVLIIEFDNGKQLKFYTNNRNHPHKQIKHIFLKNEAFQKLITDLGLVYTIDM